MPQSDLQYIKCCWGLVCQLDYRFDGLIISRRKYKSQNLCNFAKKRPVICFIIYLNLKLKRRKIPSCTYVPVPYLTKKKYNFLITHGHEFSYIIIQITSSPSYQGTFYKFTCCRLRRMEINWRYKINNTMYEEWQKVVSCRKKYLNPERKPIGQKFESRMILGISL